MYHFYTFREEVINMRSFSSFSDIFSDFYPDANIYLTRKKIDLIHFEALFSARLFVIFEIVSSH